MKRAKPGRREGADKQNEGERGGGQRWWVTILCGKTPRCSTLITPAYFNLLTAGVVYVRILFFYKRIKYHLLNMLKIKCDINQQKFEKRWLTWSCGSRQRDTTLSGWKFRLNNLAVKGLMSDFFDRRMLYNYIVEKNMLWYNNYYCLNIRCKLYTLYCSVFWGLLFKTLGYN